VLCFFSAELSFKLTLYLRITLEANLFVTLVPVYKIFIGMTMLKPSVHQLH